VAKKIKRDQQRKKHHDLDERNTKRAGTDLYTSSRIHRLNGAEDWGDQDAIGRALKK